MATTRRFLIPVSVMLIALATCLCLSGLGAALASAQSSSAPRPPELGSRPYPALPPFVLPPAISTAGSGTETFGLDRGEQLVRKGTSQTAASVMYSFDTPAAGFSWPDGGKGTYLVLQNDGNLVEYETVTDRVLFVAGNQRGVRFIYQLDGNAVLYDATNNPIFSTGTAGDTVGQFLHSFGNGQIVIQSFAGSIVNAFGTAVTPYPNAIIAKTNPTYLGKATLSVLPDGNVVLLRLDIGVPLPVLWQTRTTGAGKVRLVAQADGNLVLYKYPTNEVLWASNTSTRGLNVYHKLLVTDNGDLQLWRTAGGGLSSLTWSSGTEIR